LLLFSVLFFRFVLLFSLLFSVAFPFVLFPVVLFPVVLFSDELSGGVSTFGGSRLKLKAKYCWRGS